MKIQRDRVLKPNGCDGGVVVKEDRFAFLDFWEGNRASYRW